MIVRQTKNTFIRFIGEKGDIINQMTRHDRNYNETGADFLREISREPQDVEEIVDRLARLYGESVSREELKADFKSAVDDYLECCSENNIEPEKTYKGSLNVRFSPETHRKATLIAFSEHISLNQFIENSVREKIESYNLK